MNIKHIFYNLKYCEDTKHSLKQLNFKCDLGSMTDKQWREKENDVYTVRIATYLHTKYRVSSLNRIQLFRGPTDRQTEVKPMITLQCEH